MSSDGLQDAFEEKARMCGYDLSTDREGDFLDRQTDEAFEFFRDGVYWCANKRRIEDGSDTLKLARLMEGLEIPPAASLQGSEFLWSIGKAIASQAKQVAERSNHGGEL